MPTLTKVPSRTAKANDAKLREFVDKFYEGVVRQGAGGMKKTIDLLKALGAKRNPAQNMLLPRLQRAFNAMEKKAKATKTKTPTEKSKPDLRMITALINKQMAQAKTDKRIRQKLIKAFRASPAPLTAVQSQMLSKLIEYNAEDSRKMKGQAGGFRLKNIKEYGAKVVALVKSGEFPQATAITRYEAAVEKEQNPVFKKAMQATLTTLRRLTPKETVNVPRKRPPVVADDAVDDDDDNDTLTPDSDMDDPYDDPPDYPRDDPYDDPYDEDTGGGGGNAGGSGGPIDFENGERMPDEPVPKMGKGLLAAAAAVAALVIFGG